MIAERRAFDIQQTDYADRFSVFDAISNALYKGDDLVLQETSDFMEMYNQLSDTSIVNRLKTVCEAGLSPEAYKEVIQRVDEGVRQYLVLGPERLKALAYNVTLIRKELGIVTFNKDDLALAIYSEFHEGDRVSKVDLKTRLSEIYSKVNYDRIAKASDIEDWFEIKNFQARNNGKKENGFELVKSKNK